MPNPVPAFEPLVFTAEDRRVITHVCERAPECPACIWSALPEPKAVPERFQNTYELLHTVNAKLDRLMKALEAGAVGRWA